jgi:hypothetical protein
LDPAAPFCIQAARRPLMPQGSDGRKDDMADLSGIRPHMTVLGADGVKVGTVDSVAGGRIKLIKADSGSHAGHHHYISGGLVAAVEGETVRLSANGDAAVLLEEEQGGEALADRSAFSWRNVGIGAAAAVGLVAASAAFFARRGPRED